LTLIKKNEKKSIGWHFPPNNGGLAAGANDGAIDAFAGARLSSVVREVIQNSLDAKKVNSEPVKLHFSRKMISQKEFLGFSSISNHIEKSKEMAEKQELGEVIKFYDHGLSQIQKSNEVNIFCIHDYNTRGLTGPIDEPYGPWFAITKGAGISQKSSLGSLGSFGHGSKAPFAFSDTRTVFYLTKIDTKNGVEERFQGKSILQTHEHPSEPGIYTQGTGFFGHIDGLRPLISDDIPNWAQTLRKEVTNQTGTSIYVPYTTYNPELYPETVITIIANFFYAIHSGKLEVTVGDELINAKNLKTKYYEHQAKMDYEQDEIDIKAIEECFKSAKTVLEYDYHNAQEIPGFGKILWWMRLTEEVSSRTVGIARNSGMLITRRPIQLERFKGVKNFDLFVCVVGNKGSDLLKTLENPTHDNFEFDRIKIESSRKEAQRKYKIFSTRVREVIQKFAAIDTTQEEDLDVLSFLFNNISEETSEASEKTERGGKLRILAGPTSNGLQRSKSGSELEYITDAFSRGITGGGRDEIPKGGNIPDVNGSTLIKGKPNQTDGKDGGKTFNLSNLRIAHSRSHDKKAKLFFDSPVTGEFRLSIKAVGEHGSEKLPLVADGQNTTSLSLTVEAGVRHELNVEFENEAKMFVMEASLNES